jgi:tetratricopeptide (TPR) repeat protein
VDVTGVSYEELGQRALGYFWGGKFREAIAVYDAMMERLALEPDGDPRDRAGKVAKLEVYRATALKRAGALLAAVATAERAVSLANQFPEIQAEAYIVLADLHYQRGLLPLAGDAANRAIELSREAGLRTQGLAWNAKAQAAYASGDHEQAGLAFLEARKRIEASGDKKHRSHIEGNIGACFQAQGDLGQAREWIERALSSAREFGQPALEAVWLVGLGRVELLEGRLDAADEHAKAALRIAMPREQTLTIFRAEWLRHKVAMERKSTVGNLQRMDRLRKLYLQLDQHRGIEEIQEFRDAAISASSTGSGNEP